MKFRQRIKKWLYESCPGFAGSFPYYGTKVYFPKNSHIFNLVCEQGAYEIANVKLISTLLRANSVYFDVGANIGLMSIPLLHACPSCTVVSMEPSPNALPFLIRTLESSSFSDRWRVIGKAAGSSVRDMEFCIASIERGAFDGLQNTRRAGATRKMTVPVTTLDTEWEAMSRPPVSVIKIDVEGAETQVLQGTLACIKNERPYILVEWNSLNLNAYKCETESLLMFADSINYHVFSINQLCSQSYFLPINFSRVTDYTTLKLQMMTTENFLLAPDMKLIESCS